MKRIQYALALVILIPTSLTAQWSWQNPKPTGNDLHDVKFIDANTGWFVGDNGTVFKTLNAGATWTSIAANPQYNFSRIDPLDFSHIWLLGVGYDSGEVQQSVKILFSSDGGNSWEKRMSGASLPDSLRFGFHDIHFMSSTFGSMVGDSGLVLTTTDGGLDWQFHNRVRNYTLNRIQFLNDSLGFVCGGLLAPPLYYQPNPLSVSKGMILRTTDAGAQWDTLYSDTISIYNIHFRSPALGWALGVSLWFDTLVNVHQRNYLLKTSDGGASWQRLSFGTYDMEDVFFIDDQHGWIAGPGGQVLWTTDGGLSWNSDYPAHRSWCASTN